MSCMSYKSKFNGRYFSLGVLAVEYMLYLAAAFFFESALKGLD